MEFDITAKDGEIEIGEKATALMKQYQEACRQADQMKLQMDAFKEAMTDAMSKAGVKKWQNDFVTVTYIPEGERTVVDTKALKDQGLYECFSKKSKVAAHVTMKFNDAD